MSQTQPEGDVIVRPMTMEDLEQVVAIDRNSFPTPWSEDAFRYELIKKRNSVCRVAERRAPEEDAEVIASIVVWLVLDEVHIATLAVKPGYRRQRIAQQLLARTLIECAQQGAKQALLEVRKSNQAARSLYRKFDFKAVGLRRGYYQDTHEDAVLMTLASLDPDKLADLVEAG